MSRLLIALMLAVIACGGNTHSSLAQDDGSSIESAVELGEVGVVDDFDVTISDIDMDAEDAVLDANSGNVEPEDGYQYVLIDVEVEYTGTETGDAGFGLTFKSVGSLGIGYVSYLANCGYLDSDQLNAGELEPGETAEFTVCWSVPEEEVDSLIVYVIPLFSENESGTVWFSIGNDAPEFDIPEIGDDVVTENSNRDAVEFGGSGQVGDYLVSVVDVKADATDLIMNANSFNEEPKSGNQFYLVRVSVTYVGDEIGNPAWEMSYVSIGDSDIEYTTYDNSCGVIPTGEFSVDDVFPGTEVEYNVCWQIDSEDEDSLVLRVENFLNFDDDPVWFSLTED
jgi:hypothetical protein